MLQTLKIKNVALIDVATLSFDNGLNVISGETGAGKSILLDALSFVFGGRADKSLIRENETSMQVEAIFTNIPVSVKINIENILGIDCGDEIFLSRSLDLNGKNICKINGELVPVAVEKRVCSLLVDLHGQSEHLSILNNDYQLHIIDLYSKQAQTKLDKLATLIEKVKQIDEQLKALGGSEKDKQNLIDLYTYQINEIENAEIKPTEYEDLSTEKRTMQQFEKINEALKTAYEANAKNGFEPSATEQLGKAKKAIQAIMGINPHYAELYNRISSSLIELEDISDSIHTDLENNNYDEERFNYVDNRLDFIKSLFRKYGGDYNAMMEYFNTTQEKLDNLINGEKKYNQLIQEKQKIIQQIIAEQETLSAIRKKSAQELIKKMQAELQVLGMKNAKLDVQFSKIAEEYSYTGADRVEFLFSSNLGFELKPLNKVVSGGEMSRVMLAYKIVVSSVDQISTILFDEIDSGLSGNIAQVVAEYMARLSLNKQIIAISHLPQICAMADTNIKVEKYSDKVTTHTKAEILSEQDLYAEIARLMGTTLNDAGLKVSKELKQNCNNYKQKLIKK